MKKENNKTVKLAVLVLALAMMGMILVSGTFAKYTTEATGTSSARVAKWSIFVGDKDIVAATDKTITIDLFKTILDTNTTSGELDAAETDVKAGTATQAIIAPGTGGEFDIDITNKSEVNAKATIKFELTNGNNIPLEFKVGNGTWKSAADFNNSTEDLASLAMESTSATTTKVQWRWAYETGTVTNGVAAGDPADTALGQAGTATAEVKVTVTATQVN